MAKACERLASVARLDSAENEARRLQLPAGRAGHVFVARVQLLQTLIAARITGIMMPKLKMNLTMAAMPSKRGSLPDRALLADCRARYGAGGRRSERTHIVLFWDDPRRKAEDQKRERQA
jgi:hypothetical protein